MDGPLLTIAGWVIVFVLLPMVKFLTTKQIEAFEKTAKERDEQRALEVKALEAVLGARMDRAAHDVNAIGRKVEANYQEMLRDYVHEDRLRERMESVVAPILVTLDRIERNLERDIKDVYLRMDRKLDR